MTPGNTKCSISEKKTQATVIIQTRKHLSKHQDLPTSRLNQEGDSTGGRREQVQNERISTVAGVEQRLAR